MYDHGVTEEEVYQVLHRADEDRPGDEESRVALGKTWAGRLLKVIYKRDLGGDVFVITAFDLRGKPLQAFRRRQRRRRK
jgi:hypothetical protein